MASGSDSQQRVVNALMDSYKGLAGGLDHVDSYALPSMEAVAMIVERCRELIFPGFIGRSLVRATPTELREHVRERVAELAALLRQQVYRGLHHRAQREKGTAELDCPHCLTKAEQITDAFLGGLTALREALALDVVAHFEGDPAATGTDEVIFCYPGLYAISVYRIAHALVQLEARLIPRMMSELAHERVGIEIHPNATVGRSFFIDHGVGVVVGETAVIGDRVRLYQGVTLGALSVKDRRHAGEKRHPTIEDDVVIYSGATILGGNTVVGRGAIIGGNCWVTSSIPENAVVGMDGVRKRSGK